MGGVLGGRGGEGGRGEVNYRGIRSMDYARDRIALGGVRCFSLSPRGTSGERAGERGRPLSPVPHSPSVTIQRFNRRIRLPCPQLRAFEGNLRVADVQEWSQLINVRVPVADQRVERMDVQRC